MREPRVTVIVAMSADGKIADHAQSPARFGSSKDKAHLERRIAEVDAVMFGAGTLRAYGTSLPIRDRQLIHQRLQQGRPAQPTHLVCSRSGRIDHSWRFFEQPIPRWLLTSAQGAQNWVDFPGFERILPVATHTRWNVVMAVLREAGFNHIAVLGGGTLIASLLEDGWIQDLWLTVCPVLLGGRMAPTPVEGEGWLEAVAPRLELLSAETHQHEVFLHYQLPTKTR